jgi:histidinol-phosphate/aromatic aminotransferase/cobyric acid decarboxylase-like protein
VRPTASFGVERGLRITVGTPEENARLVQALRVVLGRQGRA